MQFFRFLLFAATVLAGSVLFVNQDANERRIIFTRYEISASPEDIPQLTLGGLQTANQNFPTGWVGSWYSVTAGAADVVGVLGEVRFNAWNDLTFFDVSAIANPNDYNGVKEIFPLDTGSPVAGCQDFPCANAFNNPSDSVTYSTASSSLVCLVGTLSTTRPGIAGRMSHDSVIS